MVSYTAINDHHMSINGELMTGLLKNDMGFDGFLISDYDAVGKIMH
jgi:beta-glucosidase-like glycosyl hydrolase